MAAARLATAPEKVAVALRGRWLRPNVNIFVIRELLRTQKGTTIVPSVIPGRAAMVPVQVEKGNKKKACASRRRSRRRGKTGRKDDRRNLSQLRVIVYPP